jgi:hypothetical protein
MKCSDCSGLDPMNTSLRMEKIIPLKSQGIDSVSSSDFLIGRRGKEYCTGKNKFCVAQKGNW